MTLSAEAKGKGQNKDASLAMMEQILEPLQHQKGGATDYARLRNDVLEMTRRFRSVEALYSDAYAKVISLEKRIASFHDNVQH